MEPLKITFIGIGLIGGSMALDMKRLFPNTKRLGIDQNAGHISEAIELGIIDEETTLDQLADNDMVVIAIPVGACKKILSSVLDNIGKNTLVFDVGSTKASLCQEIANHKHRNHFLAAHPIAGTEFSGPKAAVENLFEHKTNILCESHKTDSKLLEKAVLLFTKLGMRLSYMDPIEHDRHIAYVSHLSHISSFMLGKTVIEKEKDERNIFDMAGSGFESTVRLAKSSPAMWTPIFEENKANVVESLKEYIANLEAFKTWVENDDFQKVYESMANTNHIKNILNGITSKNNK
ncbi:MAG: prephenate dehydrogenase [Flavobacteriaceae bacterium]|nr:prephenate dehydrogenase [Flavobacteriaceae bacterium]MDG2314119.1 prephenate dehydrogenase [Flavobacteriaceae bacterium]